MRRPARSRFALAGVCGCPHCPPAPMRSSHHEGRTQGLLPVRGSVQPQLSKAKAPHEARGSKESASCDDNAALETAVVTNRRLPLDAAAWPPASPVAALTDKATHCQRGRTFSWRHVEEGLVSPECVLPRRRR